ncbi:helix-turn-helix domain-containing protein [Streptomyces sp. NPDC049040]|uniref:helix-turn-helix domain-containing protein n=1 Tax=Streptomyces sp. NPDC049040 TaxID=3365593 RepID=UPI00372314CA
MGRPEKPLSPDGPPALLFAYWLRELRDDSGMSYKALVNRTGYGKTTLNDAMGGRKQPSRAVTMAIVAACGGDSRRWAAFWSEVRRALDPQAVGPVEIHPPPWDARPPARGGVHSEQCPPGCASTEPHGWYTASVLTQLTLDTPTPEAVERRVVVATCDGLARIPLAFSVPRHSADAAPRHGLDVSVRRGGRLAPGEQPYESFFRHELVLPAPLRAGERHEYVLRLRIPPKQPMAPHFVHVPLTRSERFGLRVRFDPARPPRAVWRLTGVPTAVIYQRTPGTALLRPDQDSCVTVDFDGMRVGYGYGLCWRDA